MGYKDIRINTVEGTIDEDKNAHVQLALKGAIGYENMHFNLGLSASTLIRNIQTDNYNINLSTEQFNFLEVSSFTPINLV